jgi:hypothetical protein
MLKLTIDNIIKYKITKDHLKNYFNYLFTQADDYINKKYFKCKEPKGFFPFHFSVKYPLHGRCNGQIRSNIKN